MCYDQRPSFISAIKRNIREIHFLRVIIFFFRMELCFVRKTSRSKFHKEYWKELNALKFVSAVLGKIKMSNPQKYAEFIWFYIISPKLLLLLVRVFIFLFRNSLFSFFFRFNVFNWHILIIMLFVSYFFFFFNN